MARGTIPNPTAAMYATVSTAGSSFNLENGTLYLVQIQRGGADVAALYSVYVTGSGGVNLVKFAESATSPATVSAATNPARITIQSLAGNVAASIINTKKL